MTTNLAMIRGRMVNFIQVRGLAASYKLEQRRSMRVLEKRAIWMRENGFDRIKVIVEMHDDTLRRLHAGLDLEPFNTVLYNPRQPPTSEKITLDIKIEIESLRLEDLLSKPLPPTQYDLSPRRSPSAGTGLNEPGVPHPEMQQMEQEGTFPFQAGADGFLYVDCMRTPEQT